MHALWARKTLHSPANAYYNAITAFYSIIIFLSDRKQIKVLPVSGTKAILKVIEKNSNVREKIILVPFG